MSFGYLPTPLFIIVFIAFSLALLMYATKVFTTDKFLAVGYLLLSLSGFCSAISRGIESYYKEFSQYNSIINFLLGSFIFVGFCIIAIRAWQKTDGDMYRRKIVQVSFGAILLSIVIIGVIIVVFG